MLDAMGPTEEVEVQMLGVGWREMRPWVGLRP